MFNKSEIKILVVSYYFAPGNLMGAVRPSKLAKYFKREGYIVNVISSKDNKWLFLNNEIKIDSILLNDTKDIDVYRPSHSLFYKLFASTVKFLMNIFVKPHNSKNIDVIDNNKNERKSIKHILAKNAMFFMALLQDVDFTLCAIFSKKIRRVAKDSTHIISSYGPYSSHFLAYVLKSIYGTKITWVADFRDPIAQPTDTFIQYHINKWIENRICKKANQIVSVSDGYMNSIVNSTYINKTNVITNGFDKEDLNSIPPNNQFAGKFIISYTGTTYGGRRDLRPIFMVIKELVADKYLNSDAIEFHYAGPESELIKQLGIKYGIEQHIKTFGSVPRNESILINNYSSLIIVATWNDKNHLGVLPGKFFESLMFDKPLLILVSGKIGESEIVKITNELELGVTYEEVNDEFDYLKLKNYIKDKLLRLNSSVLSNSPNINKFNYQNIANEYLKILNK